MGYEVIYPPDSVTAKPIIVHIPHSSTCIPARYRHEICLDDAELTAELLAMTDRFTDQLFGHLPNSTGVHLIIHHPYDAPYTKEGRNIFFKGNHIGRRPNQGYSLRDKII